MLSSPNVTTFFSNFLDFEICILYFFAFLIFVNVALIFFVDFLYVTFLIFTVKIMQFAILISYFILDIFL